MKNQLAEHVIGIPFSSVANHVDKSRTRLLLGVSSQYQSTGPVNGTQSFKQSNKFAHRVREHVRLGPKITETLKGKLSLAARILQKGGIEKVFRQLFSVREGEKLLNASQCYLSTTAGPIAGLLFVSTDKVTFCSERSIRISSPSGELIRVHYKVMIPLRKIKRVNQSEDIKKPSQKYIEMVTMDNFDFWFMGFLSYQKAFRYLQQAISQS